MKIVKYTLGCSTSEVLDSHIPIESALLIVKKIIETSRANVRRELNVENSWIFSYGDEDICKLIIIAD